jgi:hypothetical protein
MRRCLPSKAPFILARFQTNLNFLNIFSKHTQTSDLMKIRPVGTKLFLAETNGWTDMTKVMVAFCNFVKVPNKTWVTTITWISAHCVLSTCLPLHRHRERPKSYPTIIS